MTRSRFVKGIHAHLPSFSGGIAMKRLSETAGLLAGLALLIGALVMVEPYVARQAPLQTAALIETNP
jgi:VIT1/CCC1 family predicted Fe2+/Mn2+ transporter